MNPSLELAFDEIFRKLDEMEARWDQRFPETRALREDLRVGAPRQIDAEVVADNWGGEFEEPADVMEERDYEPAASDAASPLPMKEQLVVGTAATEYTSDDPDAPACVKPAPTASAATSILTVPASMETSPAEYEIQMREPWKPSPCVSSSLVVLFKQDPVQIRDREFVVGDLSPPHLPRLHRPRRAPRRPPPLCWPRCSPSRLPRLRQSRPPPPRPPWLHRPPRAPPRRRERPPRLLVRGRHPRLRARAWPRTRTPRGAPRDRRRCLRLHLQPLPRHRLRRWQGRLPGAHQDLYHQALPHHRWLSRPDHPPRRPRCATRLTTTMTFRTSRISASHSPAPPLPPAMRAPTLLAFANDGHHEDCAACTAFMSAVVGVIFANGEEPGFHHSINDDSGIVRAFAFARTKVILASHGKASPLLLWVHRTVHEHAHAEISVDIADPAIELLIDKLHRIATTDCCVRAELWLAQGNTTETWDPLPLLQLEVPEKTEVLSTLHNRCSMKALILIQSCFWLPSCCCWDAVLHRQHTPWSPPTVLPLVSFDAKLRPLPWPSFHVVERNSVTCHLGQLWKPPWHVPIQQIARCVLAELAESWEYLMVICWNFATIKIYLEMLEHMASVDTVCNSYVVGVDFGAFDDLRPVKLEALVAAVHSGDKGPIIHILVGAYSGFILHLSGDEDTVASSLAINNILLPFCLHLSSEHAAQPFLAEGNGNPQLPNCGSCKGTSESLCADGQAQEITIGEVGWPTDDDNYNDDNYLCVTACFVDAGWKLQRRIVEVYLVHLIIDRRTGAIVWAFPAVVGLSNWLCSRLLWKPPWLLPALVEFTDGLDDVGDDNADEAMSMKPKILSLLNQLCSMLHLHLHRPKILEELK